jgi:hypothetical protein
MPHSWVGAVRGAAREPCQALRSATAHRRLNIIAAIDRLKQFPARRPCRPRYGCTSPSTGGINSDTVGWMLRVRCSMPAVRPAASGHGVEDRVDSLIDPDANDRRARDGIAVGFEHQLHEPPAFRTSPRRGRPVSSAVCRHAPCAGVIPVAGRLLSDGSSVDLAGSIRPTVGIRLSEMLTVKRTQTPALRAEVESE